MINYKKILVGSIVVFVIIVIAQVTTPNYFIELGEERHHYFVAIHPLHLDEKSVDYVMLCHYYFGEWIDTEDKKGCDFRTPGNLKDFEDRLVAGGISKENEN
jgi:hypothetical protein